MMSEGSTTAAETWVAPLAALATLKGAPVESDDFLRRLAWQDKGSGPAERLARAARECGAKASLIRLPLSSIPQMLMPVACALDDGSITVLHSIDADHVTISFPHLGGDVRKDLPRKGFETVFTGEVGLIDALATGARDARLEHFLGAPSHHWLRKVVLADRKGYGSVAVASLFANLLAFGASLFAMQVWDRVIPARSEATLLVLALGVFLALMLELLLRTARVAVLERLGRQADDEISSRVFARALDIRPDARPKSTGALISQLRDIEQIRELLTSSTVTAIVDLPFIILFMALFTLLAGPLTLVLVAAAVLIVIPGMLIQGPLARLARDGMKEASLRQAILVESIERIDEIKAVQAEPRFQSLWEKTIAAGASVGTAQRFYTGLYANWTQTLQQVAYVVVVLAGAFQVMDGNMTMGALIACSILTNRALVLFVPFGSIFMRLQSARMATTALKELFARPVDHNPEAGHIRRSVLHGHYEIDGLVYAYGPDSPPVLRVDRLNITAGERVALLGRIGAGKSTLLRSLAGMARPQSGAVMLDGVNLALLNPADLRRDAAYLGQGAQLFFGTIRENLVMGAPSATDDEILRALAASGALAFVQAHPQGLDLMLQEGGAGLSGGQRQTLLLARTLLRNSNILLLDEPSAPLDDISERALVANMRSWLGSRTLIVTTNRPGILELVDRVLVIENGRVAMDGPKEQIVASLTRPRAPVTPFVAAAG